MTTQFESFATIPETLLSLAKPIRKMQIQEHCRMPFAFFPVFPFLGHLWFQPSKSQGSVPVLRTQSAVVLAILLGVSRHAATGSPNPSASESLPLSWASARIGSKGTTPPLADGKTRPGEPWPFVDFLLAPVYLYRGSRLRYNSFFVD